MRLLPIVLICAGLTAVPAWQGIDPDELQTHSGPYLPTKGAFGFRVDTKLVETPVVVRDRGGRAVAGLRQQDFEVYDGGKKREVTTFAVQNSSGPSAPPVTVAPAAPDAGNAREGAEAAKRETRYVAFVFDDENWGFDNLSPDGLSRSVDAGVRFVQEGLSKGDRAAVFSLSQGPVSPLTADASKLIEGMKSLRIHRRIQPPSRSTGCVLPYTAYVLATRAGGGGPAPAPAPARAPAQAADGAGVRRPAPPNGSAGRMRAAWARGLWAEVRSNSQRLLGMLEDVVDFMGKLPGKRVVLVASPGFQTGTLDVEAQQVIDRAVRANVVINSMDVTGLWGGPTLQECSPGWEIGEEMQQAADAVLSNLADGTGGRFFHNNNDLLQAFRDLGAPPEASYVLGFVPDNVQDGRYHKVQVRVNPGSGYAVEARPGYFALAPDKGKSAQEREIDRAVRATDTRNDIPVHVTVVKDNAKSVPAVWVVAHVDVSRLEFRRVDDRRVQDLTMIAALFDAKGDFVVGKEGGVSFSLRESSFTTLSKEGVNCTLTLLAPPGSYRLRTVVKEAASGRLVASNDAVELR